MKLLLLFLVLINNSFADESAILQKVEVNPASANEIVQIGLKHLSIYPPKGTDALEILETLERINNGLMSFDYKSTNAFFFTEFFKIFYDFRDSQIIDAKNIHISSSHLATLDTKIKKYELIYSDYAKFFINDLIKNYTPYKDKNYLNNYLNKSNKAFEDKEKQKRLKRVNQHIGPWIMLFLQYDAEKFNQECSKYLWKYFQSLAYLSKVYTYNIITPENSDTIFYTDDMSLKKYISQVRAKQNQNDAPVEESPESTVEKINIQSTEGASEKIDDIMENLDEKTN